MVWQAQHRGSVSGYDVPYLVPEYIGNGGKCSDRNLHLRYAYVPYAVHTVLPESVPHELNQQTTGASSLVRACEKKYVPTFISFESASRIYVSNEESSVIVPPEYPR